MTVSLNPFDVVRKFEVALCGCYQKEARSFNHLIHGMTDSPEKLAWNHMIQRCYDPNGSQWKNYGGRGIKVCERWRTSFLNFLADIGCKPSPQHSIDRINNDGNYESDNCRWATASEQRQNQRKKTVCKRGHPFSPENTFHKKGTNQRECRICMRERTRNWRKAAMI